MKFSKGLATMALAMAVLPTAAQQEQIPTSIASSVAQVRNGPAGLPGRRGSDARNKIFVRAHRR